MATNRGMTHARYVCCKGPLRVVEQKGKRDADLVREILSCPIFLVVFFLIKVRRGNASTSKRHGKEPRCNKVIVGSPEHHPISKSSYFLIVVSLFKLRFLCSSKCSGHRSREDLVESTAPCREVLGLDLGSNPSRLTFWLRSQIITPTAPPYLF